MQYRDQILPLSDLASLLPERRKRPRTDETKVRDKVSVVVVSGGGRPVGLIVDGILDIVGEDRGAERPRSRAGVLRCSVIQEKVTEMLDLDELLRVALPQEAP